MQTTHTKRETNAVGWNEIKKQFIQQGTEKLSTKKVRFRLYNRSCECEYDDVGEVKSILRMNEELQAFPSVVHCVNEIEMEH